MITLPPHIQNAETPITKSSTFHLNDDNFSPVVNAAVAESLEREGIYLREVLEKALKNQEHCHGGSFDKHCSACQVAAAYEQLKKDLQ